MRIASWMALVVVVVVAFGGCGKARTQKVYQAQLTGDDMVPAVKTKARGEGFFNVDESGQEFHFDIQVEQMQDVTSAALYLGAPGNNGDLVAELYDDPVTGPFTGPLVFDKITDGDLTGPLEGQGISGLVAKITEGEVYVVVASREHPAGAIRGQVH